MNPEKKQIFDHLSNVTESLRPLIPVDIDILSMRTQLIEAGLKLGISELERQSLAESQFRDLKTGRGIEMVAVLGDEKAKSLMDWCQQTAEGGPKLKSKGKVSEGSEGRGLRQLAADIIQIVATPAPTEPDLERFCLRTNQRVMKGLLRENKGNAEATAKTYQVFAGIPEPESTFSSVPSGSVAELWKFLTNNFC